MIDLTKEATKDSSELMTLLSGFYEQDSGDKFLRIQEREEWGQGGSHHSKKGILMPRLVR